MSPSRQLPKYRGSGEVDPVDRHVGQRLRHLRHLAGLSQTALGQTIGVTFQQIQKYEKGANRISASGLWHLAAALGARPTDFFAGLASEEPSAPPALSREALAVARHFDAIALTPLERQTILHTFKIIAEAQAAASARTAAA